MEINYSKIQLGDYLLVNNKYIGRVVKIIWNSNGFILKLENNSDYLDKTLSQYKLLDIDNILGYMLISPGDNIVKINIDSLQHYLNNIDNKELLGKINRNYDSFLKSINSIQTSSISSQYYEDDLSKTLFIPDDLPIFLPDESLEENYKFFFKKIAFEILTNAGEILWSENFAGENNSRDVLGDENIDKIKENLLIVLESFEQVKTIDKFNLKNTVMFKHLLRDSRIDIYSLGKELISIIKEELLEAQKEIKLDETYKLYTNIFDFLECKIKGQYIIITPLDRDCDDMRLITPELVPDLHDLSSQYSKPIDYELLLQIILNSKTYNDVILNKNILEEVLKILSQDYIFCLQPKVDVLLWTITRLIISWFAEPKLFDNICGIKILINLFRARNIEELTIENEIKPIILIIPKYGKKIGLEISSRISYFLFPYKKLGWIDSEPFGFDKIDSLMYYINGSLLFPKDKFNKFVLLHESKTTSPMTKDMIENILYNADPSKIEYEI